VELKLKDFAAIDFETANREPSSVCSVGVVIVRNGVVHEKFYELIRPAPNAYDYWNTRIHGLSGSDTATADLFPEVWARIVPRIADLPLVAHNSPFDEGCLRAAHLHYAMPYPAYTFHCTCRTARRAFPHLPNHKLHTVAAHVGFDLHNHHHALADAEACAAIAMEVFIRL
jgi:DNA polymerase-3 subunit epsilon